MSGGSGIAAALTAFGMRQHARALRLWAHPAAHDPAMPLAGAVREARSLLVIALAEIGDAVLLSSLLRTLRPAAPHARITLVVRPQVRELFAVCPYVDEVLDYDPRAPRLLRPAVLPLRARRFARARLRGRPVDVAVVPRWDVDHHLATAVALFSGARRRVGFGEAVSARKARLNAGMATLLTDVVPGAFAAHEVERLAEVARAMGAASDAPALELWLTDADRERAAAVLAGAGAPLVTLGIGAADPKRRWPPERYAAAARALQEQLGAHVVVVGGAGDEEAQRLVLERLGAGAATGVAGELTLRQTAAVLARCQLFVGNDSAPLHLAAAAGVPCVELSCHPADGDPRHNNAPERFRPWGVPHAVLRPPRGAPPCGDHCAARDAHCILQITVADVVAQAVRLVASSTTSAVAPAALSARAR